MYSICIVCSHQTRLIILVYWPGETGAHIYYKINVCWGGNIRISKCNVEKNERRTFVARDRELREKRWEIPSPKSSSKTFWLPRKILFLLQKPRNALTNRMFFLNRFKSPVKCPFIRNRRPQTVNRRAVPEGYCFVPLLLLLRKLEHSFVLRLECKPNDTTEIRWVRRFRRTRPRNGRRVFFFVQIFCARLLFGKTFKEIIGQRQITIQ